MALGNLVILSEVICYLLAVIFALFMFLPIAVNLGQFNGHCLLEARGVWVDDALRGDILDVDHWGRSANCNFPVFAGVASFPLAAVYVVWMTIYLLKGTEPSWLAAFSSVIVNCIFCMFQLVCACVITHGLGAWCSLVEKNISRCSDAQYMSGFLKDTTINSDSFYIQFEIAKFGAWTSFICWVVLIGCSSSHLYGYHRREDFLISMSRERQRLLQRVRGSEYNETI